MTKDHAHPLVACAQQVARGNPSLCPACGASMRTSHEDWCRFEKRWQVALVVEWANLLVVAVKHGKARDITEANEVLFQLLEDSRE